MEKEEIIQLIQDKHQELYRWLEKHPIDLWAEGPEGKWTSGQHIVHLIHSAQPLNKALKIPKFILKWKFGRPNRTARTYNEVKKRYLERLSEAQEDILSPYSRDMPETPPTSKNDWIKKLKKEEQIYISLVLKWKEKDLDKVLLPHPLMGRMLLREMLMWTAYHTEHHLNTLREKYV